MNSEDIQLRGIIPANPYNIGKPIINARRTGPKIQKRGSFQPPPRDTTLAAAQSLDENKMSRRRHRILSYIKLRGGATCCEVERDLDLLHQTASSFIRRLFKAGQLKDTKMRRPTRTGRMAIVWGIA
jgi:hypothetical protein